MHTVLRLPCTLLSRGQSSPKIRIHLRETTVPGGEGSLAQGRQGPFPAAKAWFDEDLLCEDYALKEVKEITAEARKEGHESVAILDKHIGCIEKKL